MICLDTTPLLWGMKTDIDPENVNYGKIIRVKAYLDHLSEQKERVMIPTPVLAEYLTLIPHAQHANEIAQISDLFYIFPFDNKAASIAAQLHNGVNMPDMLESIKQETGETKNYIRQLIKVDLLIIAIAIAQGAAKIITYDPHLARIAGSTIEVIAIPVVNS